MSSGSNGRTVVLAVDHSPFSEYAFDFYVKNVHKDGDEIILVHVPEFTNVINTPSLLTDPNIVSDLVREEESRIRALVEKYSHKMKEAHISGCVKRLSGKVGEAIVESSRTEGASLVVVGTRGMGKVRRTLLGSVSDYIVHHSSIPVLVCKHKEQKEHKDHKHHDHSKH